MAAITRHERALDVSLEGTVDAADPAEQVLLGALDPHTPCRRATCGHPLERHVRTLGLRVRVVNLCRGDDPTAAGWVGDCGCVAYQPPPAGETGGH